MVTVPVGINAYRRDAAGAPEIRLVNRYAEQAPANLIEKIALIAKPGTTSLDQFSGGNIRGTYFRAGLFSGHLFVVSGTKLWQFDGTTPAQVTGTVAGTAWPYVAWMKGIGYEYLFIADGTLLQYYSGTGSLTTVVMPVMGEAAKALASLAGFVLVSVAASRKVYFIRPGAVTIDALDFFEKESQPDNVLDMLTVGDHTLIMGGGSAESWYATGLLDAPFAPTAGHAYSRGVVDGTAVAVKEAVILVGNDGVVYEISGGVRRISTHGIEERIRTQLRREENLT